MPEKALEIFPSPGHLIRIIDATMLRPEASEADYLEFLREHHLVRTDLPLRAQVYIWNAIFMGFFLTAPFMPDEFSLPDEAIAELMAETVHRALEPGGAVSPDTVQQVSNTFTEYISRFAESANEQFKQDLEA